MELGNQIKKYRKELSLSQDALAEKLFVTRQTISNWENDKSYPDINSLLLISEVFQTSIDNLIKGDVEIMKEQVREEDQNEFNKLGKVYNVLFMAMMILPVPLCRFLGIIGAILWIALAIVCIRISFMVEAKKKQFDIYTYKEILAFKEGKSLDEIEKNREEGKRNYQKFFIALAFVVIALIINVSLAYFLF